MCHLDGTPFRAPTKLGGEVVRRLSQWGQSVIGAAERPLVVQLDPPDESDAWHVRVLAHNDDDGLDPVEVAWPQFEVGVEGTAAQLARLERLFPQLLRLGDDDAAR